MLHNPTLRRTVALVVTFAVLFIGLGAHLAPVDTGGRDFFSAPSAMAEGARAVHPHSRLVALSEAASQPGALIPVVLRDARSHDPSGRNALTRGSFAIPLRI